MAVVPLGGEAAGGSVRPSAHRLRTLSSNIVIHSEDAHQEELKRALKESTRKVEALADDLYQSSSGYLETAIAAAGRGTDAAKKIRQNRSRVRMPGNGPEEAPAVPPVAEAKA